MREKLENIQRINLNIDKDLLAEIDNYAKKLHISRTSAVSVICSEFLTQKKSVEDMGELANLLRDHPELKTMANLFKKSSEE